MGIYKFVTEHPLWAGFITFLTLVGAYWSLFTDKKIPAFLAEYRWVLAMVPWHYTFVEATGVAAVVLYVLLIRDVRAKRKAVGWLEARADEDSNDMTHRVHIFPESMETTTHFEGREPSVDLRVVLLNSSVYALTLDRMEGLLTFNKHQLHFEPVIVNQSRDFAHASHYPLKLRQRLQPETVEQIRKDGEGQLGVGKVAAWFTYTDRHDKTQSVRVALGNVPFTVKA